MTSIPDKILNRKGVNKASAIPEQVMELLNRGEIESVNLTEWLAIDHKILLANVLPQVHLQTYLNDMLDALENQGVNQGLKAIRLIGTKLLAYLDKMSKEEYDLTFHLLASHQSDSVRCWSASIIGLNQTLPIDEKLSRIKAFAADKHFGVREIAWMTVRESITQELEQAIDIFRDWVSEDNEYIRRFAVESVRPNGVWSKHIVQLKEHPELALPVITPVKSDHSKYVQDSVGN
jgi:hypothetical protein